MYIAVIVVCATLETSSCQVLWNYQQLFETIEDCELDTAAARMNFLSQGKYVPNRNCIEIEDPRGELL